MPEGDTIHRIARRIDAALAGSALSEVSAPNPRSPIHARAADLAGSTLDRAEARGKHLLLHFSGDLVVHSHLGMNGRWYIRSDGSEPRGRPWLRLRGGNAWADQNGGKILRLTTAARIRSDPVLALLGHDPLAAGFDPAAAAARLAAYEPTSTVGEALLDQSVLAGSGNAIRVGAMWRTGISPWRRISELTPAQARELVDATHAIMGESLASGRRPGSIYGHQHRPCKRCGDRVRIRSQGDDARPTWWCDGCQS